MILLQSVLQGVLLPAIVAGLLLGVAWWPRRNHGEGAWGPALALGLGYPAGHAAILGRPPFPAIEATQWLFWLALAGAAFGIAPILARGHGWLRRTVQLAVAFGVPWLLLRPMFEHYWSRSEGISWLVGASVGSLALWFLLEPLVEGPTGRHLPVVLAIVAAGGSGAIVLAGSASLGQLGGVLASVFGALTVADRLRPGRSMAAGLPAVVALLSALWITGHFYVEMPLAAALLLLFAPASAWLGRLPAVERLGPFKSSVICAAATLIPVGAALVLTYAASPGDLYG